MKSVNLRKLETCLEFLFGDGSPLPAVKGTNLTGQASNCDQNHAAYGYSISE